MAERTLRRHETDVTSLVFAIVFLGVAVVWPLVQYDVLTLPAAGVVVPVVLVAAGLAGLVSSLSRVRRGPQAGESTGPTRQPED